MLFDLDWYVFWSQKQPSAPTMGTLSWGNNAYFVGFGFSLFNAV